MRSPAALTASLLTKADQANFYRLCQLLEQFSGRRFGEGESPAADPVRFRSRVDMGFPSAELHYRPGRFEDEHLPTPALLTTFLGLVGVDGVLPYHIGRDIVTRREGHNALTEFLDIFHHRLVSRFYAVWRKYHYPAGFLPGGEDRTSQALLGLAGRALGQSGSTLAPSRWLALLGPLSRRSRTADGLRAVARHALPDVGVDVEEFYDRPVLQAAAPLGRQSRMRGGQLALGRRLSDCSYCVRLTLQLQDAAQLCSLLPGGALRNDLHALLRGYVGLRWTLALYASLPADALPPARLSGHNVWLGRNALLNAAPVQGSLTLPLGLLDT